VNRVVFSFPEHSLILLIGISGVGKTTFAHRHFHSHAILSSDRFRAMLCDDESDQSINQDVFEILHWVIAKRLKNKRLTVVDATNVQKEARKKLRAIASQTNARYYAIVFDLPEEVCLRRNSLRSKRRVPENVIHQQYADLITSLPYLDDEGFDGVFLFKSEKEIASFKVEITKEEYRL
jgi:protein phosphatase